MSACTAPCTQGLWHMAGFAQTLLQQLTSAPQHQLQRLTTFIGNGKLVIQIMLQNSGSLSWNCLLCPGLLLPLLEFSLFPRALGAPWTNSKALKVHSTCPGLSFRNYPVSKWTKKFHSNLLLWGSQFRYLVKRICSRVSESPRNRITLLLLPPRVCI